MPKFRIRKLKGDSTAFSLPMAMAFCARSSQAASKRCCSLSCLRKARTTRAPERFSRVISATRSVFFWMVLKKGTERLMTIYSTSATKGTMARNTSDRCRSMRMAMITAPMTRKGARTTRRISMATAVCSWLMSEVMRVMSVGVPKRSSSRQDRVLM